MICDQTFRNSWTGGSLRSTENAPSFSRPWNSNRLSSVNIKWGGTTQKRRLLSTDKPGAKSFAPVMEESKNVEKVRVPFLINAINVSLMIAAIGGAPFVFKEMERSDYEYEELDIDEAFYNHVKDAVSEANGEIIKKMPALEQGLESSKVARNTADVVADVLNNEALQNAVSSLIANVLGSAQFQSACQSLIKNLWNDIVTDPETTAQVVLLLHTAIQNEKIKRSFKELVVGLLQDEEVYNELTALVVKLGEEKEILDATKDLLTVSAHNALNDPEILDHSMEFATDVVGDDVVQRTSGEALRNTVTYAVRPSLSTFFSVFGVALLFFSASALKNAHMSAREGKEIDAAASIVLKNVGDIIISAFSKVIAIPQRALSSLSSALVATIKFPFQIMVSSLLSVGGIGGATLSGLYSSIEKVLSLPKVACELVTLSVHNFFTSVSGALCYLKGCLLACPTFVVQKFEIMAHSLRTEIGNICASFFTMSRSLQKKLLMRISSLSPTATMSNLSHYISCLICYLSKASLDIVLKSSKISFDLMAVAGQRLLRVIYNIFRRGNGDENTVH